MKGRLFKKLNFIPTITVQLNSSESFSNHKSHSLPISRQVDLKDEKIELEFYGGFKEEFTPSPQITIMKQEEEKEEYYQSPTEFEEKCPPGGEESVVFYTTSLRGIRKTFQDCNSIRFLLDSFKVCFHERDVSLHLEYRDELWKLLSGRVIPPKLFVKGMYIGGADEVVRLHEQGKLKKLLQGIPLSLSNSNCPCNGCGNVRFVVCFNCSGSCKVFRNDDELYITCPHCNENGLVTCPFCC